MNKKNMILLAIGILMLILIVAMLILLIFKNSDLNTGRNDTSNDTLENRVEAIGTVNERNPDGIANLDITYKNNGIEFNIEKDNIEFEQSDDEPRICMSKFQILGLKNKDIQNKINNEIQGLIDLYRNNNCAITVEENANFSNVLSLQIYATSLDENNEGYRQIGLNYRLDNGEKIQFKDLFKDNKSAKEALKQRLEEKLETYKNQQEIYEKMKNIYETEIRSFDNKEYEFIFTADKVTIYNIRK